MPFIGPTLAATVQDRRTDEERALMAELIAWRREADRCTRLAWPYRHRPTI